MDGMPTVGREHAPAGQYRCLGCKSHTDQFSMDSGGSMLPPYGLKMDGTPIVGWGLEYFCMIATGNHCDLLRCALQQPPPMQFRDCPVWFVANRLDIIITNYSVNRHRQWGQAPTLQSRRYILSGDCHVGLSGLLAMTWKIKQRLTPNFKENMCRAEKHLDCRAQFLYNS